MSTGHAAWKRGAAIGSILALGLLAAAVAICPLARAEDATANRGSVQVKFVRLGEQKVGEHEVIALTGRPLEGGEEVTFLMGRQNKYLAAAKALKEGQRIAVAWVTENSNVKWVSRVEVVGAEGPRPEATHVEVEQMTADQLRARIRDLAAQIDHLKKRIAELEAANAALRKQAGSAEHTEQAPSQHPELAPALPEGMAGFSGLLIGKIQGKEGRTFTLTVIRVVRTWENNKATSPAAAVGKTLTFTVRAESKQHLHTLEGLKAGDVATVEAANREGNALVVTEKFFKGD